MSKHTNDTASNLTLGVDIGGTHISGDLVFHNQLIADTYRPIHIEHAFHHLDFNREGKTYVLHYTETFVLPAAAGEYQQINEDHQPIQNIKAFVN